MGKLLTEEGGHLLTEAGGYLLDEAGEPPFPLTPLDLRCEINVGGWTDVSGYVYQREGSQPPVTITRGKPDETSQASPGAARWQWNNRDGRFSPKNPLGPYYGLLQRSTPVRFSVPATSSYLRTETDLTSGASCPDAAPLRISGDLDVRVDVKLTDWQGPGNGPDLLSANFPSPTARGWLLGLSSLQTGQLALTWSPDGTALSFARSTVPAPMGRAVLRATLQVSTGTVTFYTAPPGGIDSGPWTQLGDAVTTGATTLYAAAAGLQIGGVIEGTGYYGNLYAARVLSGIGGTVVASPDFTAQAPGAAAFTDAQGNAWTLSGTAEISDRDYRYHGLMSSLPPKWDVTGRDQYVAAAAGGPLRVLGQGSRPPVSSPIRRAIVTQTGSDAPVAYWPMEDGSGASQFGAAVGGNPMTWTGGPPTLASSSAFTSSLPLPALGGAGLHGLVPAYAGGTSWAVTFLADLTLPVTNQDLMQVNIAGGLAAYALLAVNTDGTVALTAYDAALNVIAATGSSAIASAIPGGAAQPLLWTMQATASGSNVKYSLVALAPGNFVGFAVSATSAATGTAGNVGGVLPSPYGTWADAVIGHVYVQASAPSVFALASPLDAWTGETAAARYARLCAENGWPCRIKGPPAVSALMGPQGIDAFPNLLAECEAADRGEQYEPREVAGLGYRTLASMLNQAPALALDYSASEPGGVSGGGDSSGLDPTYDDLLVRNDWALTRGSSTGSQGATVRTTLNDGSALSITGPAGDYADTLTVNVDADSQLADIASWMVHAGTVDEHRWPVVPLNLARGAVSALQGAAMSVDAGDTVEIVSLPDTVLYDPARELALGFTEQLGGYFWNMLFNAVPASPYDTIVLDDQVLGRLDTDGSTLASPATSAATSLSVATASGMPVWTTSAGDFPFDVAIGGERVTVTNITGSSSPQTFTVTRSVNGVAKAQSAGADVRLWTPPILSLI